MGITSIPCFSSSEMIRVFQSYDITFPGSIANTFGPNCCASSVVTGIGLNSNSQNITTGIRILDGAFVQYNNMTLIPTKAGLAGDFSTQYKYGIWCDGKPSPIRPSWFVGDAMTIAFAEVAINVNDGGLVNVSAGKIGFNTKALVIEASGSGTALDVFNFNIKNSITYDLEVKSSDGTFTGAGNRIDTTKMSLNSGSAINSAHMSLVTGDEAFEVLGELHVGTPEFPAESVFGEGDSYTRGMLIYTFDTGTLTYKDVTVSGSTTGDGLAVQFPSESIDNMIYLASTLQDVNDYKKYFGQKMTVTQAYLSGSGGFVLGEYYTTGGWKKYNRMITQAVGEFLPLPNTQQGQTGSFQYRSDWRMNQDWIKNDAVGYGTNLYWTRWRIISPISRSNDIDQIKLHSNRSEINEDGWLEYFGRARPFGTLPWDAGLLLPGAASPVSQDVYLSDTLDVGRLNNQFANNATDRIGLNAYLPDDLDTSCPIQLQWSIIGSTTEANNINWNIRWGYSTDGIGVYPDVASAPDFAANGSEQSQSLSVSPPATLESQKTYQANLEVDNMVARRGSGSFGDMLWVTLERPNGDPYGGTVSLINISAKYTKWCEGGHQF